MQIQILNKKSIKIRILFNFRAKSNTAVQNKGDNKEKAQNSRHAGRVTTT